MIMMSFKSFSFSSQQQQQEDPQLGQKGPSPLVVNLAALHNLVGQNGAQCPTMQEPLNIRH